MGFAWRQGRYSQVSGRIVRPFHLFKDASLMGVVVLEECYAATWLTRVCTASIKQPDHRDAV